LRAGTPRDAATAASLHAQLISEGFLASLGSRFLGRLYGRIVRTEGSFLLVAEADGSVIGFIAGSVAVGRLYRSFLVRDGVAAALSAPVRLLGALPRVLETLRHGSAHDGGDGGELLAVAVDPRWRARHVGRQLVAGFLDELDRRGVSSAHVVVGSSNATAIAMYRRAGFSPARTFEMHRGTQSVLMQRGVAPGTVTTARPRS
jgi:ribosomal protein S18 acetylase RimI-like enzyme